MKEEKETNRSFAFIQILFQNGAYVLYREAIAIGDNDRHVGHTQEATFNEIVCLAA